MSALKVVLPLIILAALAVTILPMFAIWFVTDLNKNVTVAGDNAGIWTFFTDGLTMITKIFTQLSYPSAIILGVCALVILLLGAFVLVKKAVG